MPQICGVSFESWYSSACGWDYRPRNGSVPAFRSVPVLGVLSQCCLLHWLANRRRSFQLQKVMLVVHVQTVAAWLPLWSWGSLQQTDSVCRFCVLEDICPGWNAWCQLAGQSPWSDRSAWHQDIGLLWAMGFVWGRLGGGGELLSRPYWGCCNVFGVFLMSRDSLTHGICDNSWHYRSAWQIVCFSWVGQRGTTPQGSGATGCESTRSHLHASASSGQQRSRVLWRLWLRVSKTSLIATSCACLIAVKCQNYIFFLRYWTLT